MHFIHFFYRLMIYIVFKIYAAVARRWYGITMLFFGVIIREFLPPLLPRKKKQDVIILNIFACKSITKSKPRGNRFHFVYNSISPFSYRVSRLLGFSFTFFFLFKKLVSEVVREIITILSVNSIFLF